MRKPLIIGAIVLVVVGVAAYIVSQPKQGTVEYHKRKLLQSGVPELALVKGVPGFVRDYYEHRFTREFEFHRRALIDAGYLRESVFVVSNASAMNVMEAVKIELPENISEFTWTSWSIGGLNSNAITVIAPREWIEKIGEAIRKADVPVKNQAAIIWGAPEPR